MQTNASTSFLHPETVEQAVAQLAALGSGGAVLAGGTWMMRQGLSPDMTFVDLGRIDELHQFHASPERLLIGSMVTQAQLSTKVEEMPGFGALKLAAGSSANPTVRGMATVGGNIAARDFLQADLRAAFLALGASVLVQDAIGRRSVALADFLSSEGPARNALIVGIEVPRKTDVRSTHQRLLLRQAGEYPVANLSVAVHLSGQNEDQTVTRASLVVGAIGPKPQHWVAAEQQLAGQKLSWLAQQDWAGLSTEAFPMRDAPDAPGWYRHRVLPALLTRALQALTQE
jgi:carbon-monoxide dehydrogenase medium subunit